MLLPLSLSFRTVFCIKKFSITSIIFFKYVVMKIKSNLRKFFWKHCFVNVSTNLLR